MITNLQKKKRRQKKVPHTQKKRHFWLIEALLHQVHSAETERKRGREWLPTGAMCCQKIQHFGHCCEEKTPCGDIVWVAGRTGRLPQIITSEINLMCGIQSVVIGTAAALERSSKCYLLIHGMRTDTQPQRIDCAISSLCAVLTQWKGQMRFNVVMHGSLWLLRSSQDSRPVLQVRISWDIRRRNISTERMHRELVGERVINNLKIFHSDCVIFLECFILMWCFFPYCEVQYAIEGQGGAIWVDIERGKKNDCRTWFSPNLTENSFTFFFSFFFARGVDKIFFIK